MNFISWLHLDVYNIHGFALFKILLVLLMCKRFVLLSKWISLIKGWGKLYLHNFLKVSAFVSKQTRLHTCWIHTFIKLHTSFQNNSSKILILVSSGLVMHWCVCWISSLTSFIFEVDLYCSMFLVMMLFR
jgi:hypothetical protein